MIRLLRSVSLAAVLTMIGCLSSCTPAAQQTGAHTLTVASSLCESIALAKGREDIAALCRATRDGAVVLDRATEPVVCEVPDAGGD